MQDRIESTFSTHIADMDIAINKVLCKYKTAYIRKKI